MDLFKELRFTSKNGVPDQDQMKSHILRCLSSLIKVQSQAYEEDVTDYKNSNTVFFGALKCMCQVSSEIGALDMPHLGEALQEEPVSSSESPRSRWEMLAGLSWSPYYSFNSYCAMCFLSALVVEGRGAELDCGEIFLFPTPEARHFVIGEEDFRVFFYDHIKKESIEPILMILIRRCPWLLFSEGPSELYGLPPMTTYIMGMSSHVSTKLIMMMFECEKSLASGFEKRVAGGNTRRVEPMIRELMQQLGPKMMNPDYFPVYRALIAEDPSVLLNCRSSTDTTLLFYVCNEIQHWTREALDLVAFLLEACPKAAKKRNTSYSSGNTASNVLPIYALMSHVLPAPPHESGRSTVRDPVKDFMDPSQYMDFFKTFLGYEPAAAEVFINHDFDHKFSLLYNVAANWPLPVIQMVYEANPAAISCHGVYQHHRFYPAGTTVLSECVRGNSKEAIQYVFSKCPKAAELDESYPTLHLAIFYRGVDIVRLVHSFCPESISQKDHEDCTPLHTFMDRSCTEDDEAVLRYLLRHDPAAAAMKNRALNDPPTISQTPYEMFMTPGHRGDRAWRRLLLRAAPAQDPATLRELNYAQRRGAMYLLFAAKLPPSKGALCEDLVAAEQGSGAATSDARTSPQPAAAGAEHTAEHAAADGIPSTIADVHVGENSQPGGLQVCDQAALWRLLRKDNDPMMLRRLIISFL